MMRVARALLLGSLVMLAETAAAASAPPTVLILPFDNATGDPRYAALERGIPDLLGAALSGHAGRVRLVERDRLDAIVRERSLSWQQYVAAESPDRIGRIIQAQYVMRGSFTRTAGRLHVQALVYETETTRLVASASAHGDPTTLVPLSEELAGQVVKLLPAGTGPQGTSPADHDPDTSLLMIQGLGHFYTGRFDRAAPAFMKVLTKHPDDATARYWLARTFYDAGLRGHAAIELRAFLRVAPDHGKAAEVRRLLDTLQEGGEKR